jgi:hypothetical protein
MILIAHFWSQLIQVRVKALHRANCKRNCSHCPAKPWKPSRISVFGAVKLKLFIILELAFDLKINKTNQSLSDSHNKGILVWEV